MIQPSINNPELSRDQPLIYDCNTEIPSPRASASTQETSEVLRRRPKRMREGTVCCNRFIVDENGVIGLSLRDLTVFTCIWATVFLTSILYMSCTDGTAVCSSTHLPMISDLIKLHFYDRIFCMTVTFYCITCLSANIRAFYKKLNSVGADPSMNAFIMFVGYV
jgi:hypothetical protein